LKCAYNTNKSVALGKEIALQGLSSKGTNGTFEKESLKKNRRNSKNEG